MDTTKLNDATKVADLTVAEFRQLMAECFAADRDAVDAQERARHQLRSASRWLGSQPPNPQPFLTEVAEKPHKAEVEIVQSVWKTPGANFRVIGEEIDLV